MPGGERSEKTCDWTCRQDRNSHWRRPICLTIVLCSILNVAGTKGHAPNLPEYMRPGVRTPAVPLDKKLFLDLHDLGTITDIQFGMLQPSAIELGAAGNFGAKFFDIDRHLLKAVLFDNKRASTIIVRGTSSAGMMFFRQEDSLGGSDGLVDTDGRPLWKVPYPCEGSTFDYCGLNGAPNFFFAVQHGALEARDASGHLIWRRQGFPSISDFHVVKVGKERASRLLVSQGGKLVTIGLKGEILSEGKPNIDSYFSNFSIVRWSTVCDQCLLISENDKCRLLNVDGNKVVKDLGPANYLSDAHGVPVRLRENEPPLLAVAGLMEYKVPSRIRVYAGLYLFNAKGSPLYYEVLPERVEALAVSLSADRKRETLLVGGEGRVWEYASH
jgi:hypothetical protein